MNKQKISIKGRCIVGNAAPTALNVLVGANTASDLDDEKKKIYSILERNIPVSIITDLSTVVEEKHKSLFEYIIQDGRCISGTVPIYQVVNDDKTVDRQKLLELIQLQAESGVGVITIHPTPTLELINMSQYRLVPITSRGGGIVCADMIINRKTENVYIEILDEILSIAKKESVVLSIGSTFRSANLHDALDSTYYKELERQLKIADYCNNYGVDVIIETPGHVPPQGIFKLCDHLSANCPYPIMPLGPIPTDCAFDQDDLAATIGAVLMGTNGCADILSIVTKVEHSGGIPNTEVIIEAIEKYFVAKHIIDIYKINDTLADYEVALKRSNNNSCLIDGRDCSRCASICPLKLSFQYEQ